MQKVSRDMDVDPERVREVIERYRDWCLVCVKELKEVRFFRKLLKREIDIDKAKLLQRELIKCSQL